MKRKRGCMTDKYLRGVEPCRRVVAGPARRRYVAPISFAAAIAVAVAVASCSAQSSPSAQTSPTHSEASTSAPVAPPPPPAPPKIPQTAHLPSGTVVRVGPGTVFSGCHEKLVTGYDVTFDAGEAFVYATGKNIGMPTPPIPSSRKMTAAACTVAGDADHLRVISVYTVKTPSSGLTPESSESELVSYDPTHPDSPVAQVPWPAGSTPEDFDTLTPTKWGVMAHGDKGVIGFDLNTLKPAWQTSDKIGFGDANFEGYVFADGSRAPDVDVLEDRYIFHSAKDGSVIGSCVGPQMNSGIPVVNHGFFVQKGKHDHNAWQSYYFDMQDAQFKGPMAPGGTFWGNNYLVYNIPRFGEAQPYIQVWDLSQNKLIFDLQGDQVAGLNVQSVNFAGKYLYIANDSDSPVIDITNQQKVSSKWVQRPTDLVSPDWMVVVPGRSAPASCFQSDRPSGVLQCNEHSMLAYAPGGKYTGRWF